LHVAALRAAALRAAHVSPARAQVLLVRNAKQLGDGELAESERMLKNAHYECAFGAAHAGGHRQLLASAARSAVHAKSALTLLSRRARSDGGKRRVQGAGSAGARNV
jgi:hypothetical protein